jgi:hypothetical protein
MDAKSNEDTWTPFENLYDGEEIKCFVLTSIETTWWDLLKWLDKAFIYRLSFERK